MIESFAAKCNRLVKDRSFNLGTYALYTLSGGRYSAQCKWPIFYRDLRWCMLDRLDRTGRRLRRLYLLLLLIESQFIPFRSSIPHKLQFCSLRLRKPVYSRTCAFGTGQYRAGSQCASYRRWYLGVFCSKYILTYIPTSWHLLNCANKTSEEMIIIESKGVPFCRFRGVILARYLLSLYRKLNNTNCKWLILQTRS